MDILKKIDSYLNEKKSKEIAKDGDYSVFRSESDKEGSFIELKYKGKVIATGDYDSGASAFFIDVGKKSSFDNVKDIIKSAKKQKLK